MRVSELVVSCSGGGQVSNGRILVVDDHEQSRQSMADILQHAGFEMVCCASGRGGTGCLRK